ncbi:hypothetical protein Y032_0121g993 [Ancylostoma ceylanicum]|uniref:Uncharacterized protein n=1 Tax=Ancylostoma ceylanicum TaxID=53326 RepID=A0A016TAE6_9BILA|nr:hypothetical protein Y032_0121g993 [Ancylostoma ceylanicum]
MLRSWKLTQSNVVTESGPTFVALEYKRSWMWLYARMFVPSSIQNHTMIRMRIDRHDIEAHRRRYRDRGTFARCSWVGKKCCQSRRRKDTGIASIFWLFYMQDY